MSRVSSYVKRFKCLYHLYVTTKRLTLRNKALIAIAALPLCASTDIFRNHSTALQ